MKLEELLLLGRSSKSSEIKIKFIEYVDYGIKETTRDILTKSIANPETLSETAGFYAVILTRHKESLLESVFEYLEQFDVEITSVEIDEEVRFKDSYQLLEANAINSKEMAPKLVKLLIATLPSREANSAFSQGLVNYRSLFNTLMRELSGIEEINEMVDKMEELKSTSLAFGGSNGPIANLIQRINGREESSDPNIFTLRRKFQQQFAKHEESP
ncbi:hypothetical protein N9E30_00710 [Flavobacteriales bacterium]|nr:hypothetical protein [Flavobacteriales bacterium]